MEQNGTRGKGPPQAPLLRRAEPGAGGRGGAGLAATKLSAGLPRKERRTVMSLQKWFYRGGHPNRVARILNRWGAAVYALGVAPNYLVTLEVPGRRSGRIISFPLVMVVVGGERGRGCARSPCACAEGILEASARRQTAPAGSQGCAARRVRPGVAPVPR